LIADHLPVGTSLLTAVGVDPVTALLPQPSTSVHVLVSTIG
jgi:hypothetical protein